MKRRVPASWLAGVVITDEGQMVAVSRRNVREDALGVLLPCAL